MRNWLIAHSWWLVVIYLLSGGLCAANAQAISSTELINHAAQYDGKVVVYAGEVVGDVMRRRDYAWLNLNDSVNAVGIWAHQGLLKEITITGSYQSKGDWVEVVGIFHRACAEHGGDLDIHAQVVRKISAGRLANERLNAGKRNIALVFAGVLCLVLILRLWLKRPSRKSPK